MLDVPNINNLKLRPTQWTISFQTSVLITILRTHSKDLKLLKNNSTITGIMNGLRNQNGKQVIRYQILELMRKSSTPKKVLNGLKMSSDIHGLLPKIKMVSGTYQRQLVMTLTHTSEKLVSPTILLDQFSLEPYEIGSLKLFNI